MVKVVLLLLRHVQLPVLKVLDGAPGRVQVHRGTPDKDPAEHALAAFVDKNVVDQGRQQHGLACPAGRHDEHPRWERGDVFVEALIKAVLRASCVYSNLRHLLNYANGSA